MADEVQPNPDDNQELADLETQASDAYEQFVKDFITIDWAWRTGRLEEWVENFTARHMGERPNGPDSGESS